MKLSRCCTKVEMTKKEFEQAHVYGSNEYVAWQKMRKDFPGITPVIKKRKQSVEQAKKRGLTYEAMEAYIVTHDDKDGAHRIEFYSLRGLDANGKKIQFAVANTYFQVRDWFYDTYPEVLNVNDAAEMITERVRESRKAKKLAELKKGA